VHILYLTHDLSDPTTSKRVRMLKAGGATVTVAGFTREAAASAIAESETLSLGQSYNGRFAQRIALVLRNMVLANRHRDAFAKADIIIARNLETLAIAVRGRAISGKPTLVVYEVLDIHRLLLRADVVGHALRTLEGWLTKRASLLITSSPAFVSHYFETTSQVKLPHLLLENKVLDTDNNLTPHHEPKRNGPPWRIGWFGAIRCRKSLDILCAVADANPDLLEVIIRGRISHDQFEDFDAKVLRSKNVSFLGPYRNPDALADIYQDVHFSWAIDMFEEGQNSTWLLPNRIYEGSLFGAVPLAAEGVETSAFITHLGIGRTLSEPKAEALTGFLRSLTRDTYRTMHHAVTQVKRQNFSMNAEDCEALVNRLRELALHANAPRFAACPEAPINTPALVIIPCLNEAAHIEALINYLLEESAETPMSIVIADGGSRDETVEIVQRLANAHANVRYLPNPKRIQSAAVNLAIEQFGADHYYLIRIDAHAGYPKGYCRTLLEDAKRNAADSVVVRMNTVGTAGFQKAVAAAQNSKLGNGGSSHRLMQGDGLWVDHGHHALMRISAYRKVGGYDERFSHNEDAELDARLRKAGHRIWLTANTTMDYYPRNTPLPLFKQYRGYGRGRVRNLLRHRERPKLRQMLPVAVAPATALLMLVPWSWLAAVPFMTWACICLAYGAWLAKKSQTPALALSGPAAMLMHSGWSLGFWQGLFDYLRGAKR
jgi:succinoglycan biosynthesis protein ExoA